jgi:hypothetical protein
VSHHRLAVACPSTPPGWFVAGMIGGAIADRPGSVPGVGSAAVAGGWTTSSVPTDRIGAGRVADRPRHRSVAWRARAPWTQRSGPVAAVRAPAPRRPPLVAGGQRDFADRKPSPWPLLAPERARTLAVFARRHHEESTFTPHLRPVSPRSGIDDPARGRLLFETSLAPIRSRITATAPGLRSQ